MENIQVNGQRIWGPPKDWTGPPPPHGTEVYVKNLPEDLKETTLYSLFSLVGEIYEVRLPVHWNGMNRGYAFIRYTEVEYADRAINSLNKMEIRPGWPTTVERSIDNNRLFLSAVPNDKNSDEIFDELKTVVDNVRRVYVYASVENPSLFRGYAFVEFVSHRDAAIAKRLLTPDVLYNMFKKKCVAAWANPLPYLQEDMVSQIDTLFIRNVPSNIKNQTLKDALENHLGKDSVTRIKTLNDIAFVTFKTHNFAKAAMELIKENTYIFGNLEVEVEWAVPRQMANSSKFEQKEIICAGNSSPIEKKITDRVTKICEKSWKNCLQNTDYLNKNLSTSESNLTDWQKNFFPNNFLNNQVILGEKEPSRSNMSTRDSSSEALSLRMTEDETRLQYLQQWLENSLNVLTTESSRFPGYDSVNFYSPELPKFPLQNLSSSHPPQSLLNLRDEISTPTSKPPNLSGCLETFGDNSLPQGFFQTQKFYAWPNKRGNERYEASQFDDWTGTLKLFESSLVSHHFPESSKVIEENLLNCRQSETLKFSGKNMLNLRRSETFEENLASPYECENANCSDENCVPIRGRNNMNQKKAKRNLAFRRKTRQ